MCRLYGFRASEPTQVECTLVRAQNALLHQSSKDARGRSNADGWGICWYEDGKPVRERRATAAFNDPRFAETAERAVSQTVLAHVRLASVGAPALENTHPFTHRYWAFAHNGRVTAFDRLGDQLAEETDSELQSHRKGTSDSEQAFYWLLSQMAHAGIPIEQCCRDVVSLTRVVSQSITDLARRCDEADADEPAKLNFILTDGEVLIASRWGNPLYYVLREGIRDCEVCNLRHLPHHADTNYRAVVIASEPISCEEWQEVPNGSILTVDASIRVDTKSMGL